MSAGSQLLRREIRATDTRRGTLIALHSDGADARELIPLCSGFAAAFDVIAPQAARSRNPFLSSAPPDDPRWRDYAGYAWFRRDDAGRPEPSSFGDSLWQIEQLVLECEARSAEPIGLLGFREGATLALGAAVAFAQRLDFAFAIDGARPEIPGWSDKRALAADLPVGLIHGGYTDPRDASEALQKFLYERTGGDDDGRG